MKLSEAELKMLIQGGKKNVAVLRVATPRATLMAERLGGKGNALVDVIIVIGVEDSLTCVSPDRLGQLILPEEPHADCSVESLVAFVRCPEFL